jgi:threonine dehydrogenase-like Zn-dependent dehydrogenase
MLNTKKAKTINYAGKEHIDFIEVDVADPGYGEVTLDGLACGVCAWDVYVYKNGVDWPVWPGHEGVARVVKVGPGVSNVKEGDVVTGVGLGFTERVTRQAAGLFVLPQRAGDEPQNWIIEPVSCVVTGIDHCRQKAGDRIAVVGCGFMGLMIVQALGKSLLDRLICIDMDPKRLELAKQFGATDVYHAAEVDPNKLRELWLDCVVDCSGNQKGLELSSKIVKNGGRLNLFGWNHGTPTFPGDTWHMNGITVVNSAPNSAERDPWLPAIRMLERGYIDLKPLISHVVPLVEYPNLLKFAAANKGGSYMKGVVALNGAADTIELPRAA